MQAVSRISTSIPIAALVTFGLFYLMQSLINGVPVLTPEKQQIKIVPFVASPRDPPPPPPTNPVRPTSEVSPGIPTLTYPEDKTPTTLVISEINFGAGKIGTSFSGLSNSTVFLVAGVPPMYPVRAIADGKEGFALVEFTVDADGTVMDAILIEESPTGYGFGRAALQAIARFSYKARMVDGHALATPGIRERFIFDLED